MNSQLNTAAIYLALLSLGIALIFEFAVTLSLPFQAFINERHIAISAYAYVCFVFLNSSLIAALLVPRSKYIRYATATTGVLVLIFSVVILGSLLIGTFAEIRSLLGMAIPVAEVYVRTNVSVVSALSFLLSAVALISWSFRKHDQWGTWLGALLTISLSVNLIAFVGHIYSSPILYGEPVNPVGFVTVLSLLLLNAALLAAIGENYFPLKYFVGNTTRAILLRNFLPLALILVLAYGWVLTFAPTYLHIENVALLGALLLIGTIVAVTFMVIRLSNSISNDIDQAQADKLSAERALAKSRERFDFILTTINEGIYDWDIRNNTFWWNRGARLLLGSVASIPDDLKEWRSRFIHPEDIDRVNTGFNISVEAGKAGWAGEYRIVRDDGAVVSVYERAQVHRNSNGIVKRVVGSLIDMTQLIEMEAERTQLALIIESTTDIVVIADHNGLVQYMNAAGRNTFGEYNNFKLADLHTSGLHVGDSSNKFLGEILPHAIKYGSWSGERRIKRKDGVELQVSELVLAHNLKDSNMFVTMVIRDISDIKKAQEQLERANEKLSESNKDLEQFAYVASHDLQEPVKAISGLLELLEKTSSDKIGADGVKIITFAKQGASRMKTLIKDLLQFSLSGADVSVDEETNMMQVMDTVRENLSVLIFDSGATISYDGLCTLKANTGLMTSLMQNLVSNGLKYRGDANPIIKVSCMEGEHRWLIAVADNGIGISPENHRKIFKVFQRLHARTEYEGTGIGLATCAKIADLHRGNIWVESAEGAGSTFYFTVPK